MVFGVLPSGQPTTVYAAPDTVTIRPNAAGDETGCTIAGSTPALTNWESMDETTEEYTDSPEYLKVYIQRLRNKLEEDISNPQFLLSERGVGYKFVRPLSV